MGDIWSPYNVVPDEKKEISWQGIFERNYYKNANHTNATAIPRQVALPSSLKALQIAAEEHVCDRAPSDF